MSLPFYIVFPFVLDLRQSYSGSPVSTIFLHNRSFHLPIKVMRVFVLRSMSIQRRRGTRSVCPDWHSSEILTDEETAQPIENVDDIWWHWVTGLRGQTTRFQGHCRLLRRRAPSEDISEHVPRIWVRTIYPPFSRCVKCESTECRDEADNFVHYQTKAILTILTFKTPLKRSITVDRRYEKNK